MVSRDTVLLICRHCGNRTPHHLVYSQEELQAYDQVGDEVFPDTYTSNVVVCGTCNGVTLTGGFRNDVGPQAPKASDYPILFPPGPDLLPPQHTLAGRSSPIPPEVEKVYRSAWPLRHTNPAAFANQIRRALELVCADKKAVGKTLFAQLSDLAVRSVFPPELSSIADLLRQVGNRGSHAGPADVDVWDAELLDELFKTLLRFLYLGPSHAERMRQRLSV